jgi:hypothetical protein
MTRALLTAMLFLAACQAPPHAQTAQTSSTHPQATDPVRQLACKGSDPFKTFTATLDGSVYDAGSGYFDVTEPFIMDNYSTARLICAGHSLGQIDCVGFWFGLGGNIAEVTVAQDDTGGYSASYASLKSTTHLQVSGGPLPCTVQ